MLSSRIAGRSLQWAKRSLTSHAALELPLHFPCAALFKWVGTTARSQACDREQDRHAFHLRILGTKPVIANKLIL
jgi:hypothetical protein